MQTPFFLYHDLLKKFLINTAGTLKAFKPVLQNMPAHAHSCLLECENMSLRGRAHVLTFREDTALQRFKNANIIHHSKQKSDRTHSDHDILLLSTVNDFFSGILFTRLSKKAAEKIILKSQSDLQHVH